MGDPDLQGKERILGKCVSSIYIAQNKNKFIFYFVNIMVQLCESDECTGKKQM